MKMDRVKLFRSSVGALAAAGMFAGVVGCSSDGEAESSGNSTTEVVESANGEYPVSIEAKFGDVTIDEAPQRVVALGWGDAETAMEFGVQPVGASD